MSGESSSSGTAVGQSKESISPNLAELAGVSNGESLSALILAMAGRDQYALRRLYELTSGAVNALAVRILGNADDAEEVIMDVYTKAWRTAAAYEDSRGSPLAWLLMMTRSLAIDKLRHRAARPLLTGEPLPVESALTADPGPEAQALESQQRNRIQIALAQLAPEQQEVLQMAFYSGLSHSEVAKQLGQPLGTVKTRIRLGLQHLKRLMSQPVH